MGILGNVVFVKFKAKTRNTCKDILVFTICVILLKKAAGQHILHGVIFCVYVILQ